MQWLIPGLILFFGMHSIAIIAPRWRDRMAARMGGAWQGLYALSSLAGLLLIIRGYRLAGQTPAVWYVPSAALRPAAWLLMVPAFTLLLAAYFPGRLRELTRHPLLLAVKCWALAHLLIGGMAHQVLVFGAFLLWAGIDRMSLKHRPPRAIRTAPVSPWNDWIAIIVGLALYAIVALWAHRAITGVSPFP
jgi:uncharacterized membrane protein